MAPLLPVAIPSAVFAFHAALFATWIVDDAGIAFAYARNLARGYGLVSQPGLPPVEGYSNPLWVFLMALLYRLHLFTLFTAPKLVSLVLVVASFGVIHRMLRRVAGASGWVSAVTLTLLAMNTPFVVWTTSGLENPLYVFLLCVLLCGSLDVVTRTRSGGVSAAGLGLVATAVALTRPEGVLYFAAFPLLLLVSRAYRQYRGRGPIVPGLLVYGAAVAVSFGLFLWLRWRYFGDLLPNTYYAKGVAFLPETVLRLESLPPTVLRLIDLLGSIGGVIGVVFAAWLLLALGSLLLTRRLRMIHAALGVMLALSLLAYLLLPPDWMKEYRFATPLLVFFYLLLTLVTVDSLALPRVREETRATVLVALAALALVGSGFVFSGRSLGFAREPEVDFAGVRGWICQRFAWYAEELGLEHGSVLVPDLGATLWYSRLRIYDLGMLCDKTIARTMGKDQKAFHDYIFEVVKPTFIHTHGSWTYYARFEEDPRFRRDYTPIQEFREPYAPGYGRTVNPHSGDYVRKEAVRGREEALARLREMAWQFSG